MRLQLPNRRSIVGGGLASLIVSQAKPAKQLCGFVADASSGGGSYPACTPTVNSIPFVQFNGAVYGLTNSNYSFFGPTNFAYMLHSSWHCNPFTGLNGSNMSFSPIDIFLVRVGSVATGGQAIGQVQVFGLPFGTKIFDATYNLPYNQQWHVLVSVNCNTQVVQVYVNDVALTLVSGGWTGSGLIPGMPNVGMITALDIGTLGGLPGVAYVWEANPASFFDLSVVANRRKFINANLTPVDLGASGQTPLGAAPPIYLVAKTSPNDLITNYGLPSQPFTISSGITLGWQPPGTCPCAV